MSDLLPAPPARLLLRPGLGVARRDDHHLQIGVDAPHRVVVRDDPDVRRLLDDLTAGRVAHAETPSARRLLAALADCGLLVDADAYAAALTRGDRTTVAVAFAQFGADAARRLDQRERSRVRIDAPPEIRQGVARLLRASGMGLAGADEQPTAVLVVHGREPSRERLDGLVRDGVAHLLLAAAPAYAVVGPFVAPGVTACARCVDAHLGQQDPRRSLVAEQHAREAAGLGPGSYDPVLLQLALAWAARDLVSHADGDRPATWSASVRVEPGLEPARHAWARHPYCGCAWGESLAG